MRPCQMKYPALPRFPSDSHLLKQRGFHLYGGGHACVARVGQRWSSKVERRFARPRSSSRISTSLGLLMASCTTPCSACCTAWGRIRLSVTNPPSVALRRGEMLAVRCRFLARTAADTTVTYWRAATACAVLCPGGPHDRSWRTERRRSPNHGPSSRSTWPPA